MKIKIFKAFSIAEALVTMMIVALIILMTMPLFTKKTPKGSGLKGAWECRIDPVTGDYKSISIPPENVEGVDADTANYGHVAEDGKSCIFTPPKSARNFTVNLIGGGGGGASASIARDSDTYTKPGIETYVPDYTGYYNILLIGGGGAGGSKNCMYGPAVDGALGGAAGGVKVLENERLEKGQTYTLTIASGGYGYDSWEGEYQSPGATGGSSIIKYPDGSEKKATGGRGGFGGHHLFLNAHDCGVSTDNWRSYGFTGEDRVNGTYIQNSMKNTGTAKGANTSAPGYICDSSGKCASSQIEELLGTSVSEKIGRGGRGATSDDSDGLPGNAGIIVISYSGLYAGSGGKAGTHVYKIYQKLPSEIVVKVGRGGPGAVLEDQDGYPGEASAFGSFAVAGGGEGGRSRDLIGSSEPGFLAGGNGGKSIYGGEQAGGSTVIPYQFEHINGESDMDKNAGFLELDDKFLGSGGGGGASIAKRICATTSTAMSFDLFQQLFFPLAYAAHVKLEQLMKDPGGGGGGGGGGGPVVVPPKPVTDYSECWGRGGRGAPGFVRVEWN